MPPHPVSCIHTMVWTCAGLFNCSPLIVENMLASNCSQVGECDDLICNDRGSTRQNSTKGKQCVLFFCRHSTHWTRHLILRSRQLATSVQILASHLWSTIDTSLFTYILILDLHPQQDPRRGDSRTRTREALPNNKRPGTSFLHLTRNFTQTLL